MSVTRNTSHSNLPIYDILFSNTTDEELSDSQKEQIVGTIPTLPRTTLEILYMLIKIYYDENYKTASTTDLPYDGKLAKNSVKFSLTRFPIRLQRMIHEFVLLQHPSEPL